MAETLIQEEMAVMLRYDAWKSPTGQPGGGGGLKERELKHFFAEHPYESVPLDALIQAKSLIDEETGVVQEERGRVGEDAVEQTCDLADKRLLFLVSEGRFGSRDEASKRDICDYLEREIDGYDVANKKLNERLVKMDAKLDVVTAGYRRRVQQASKQMEETESQWEQALLDLTSFDHLKRQEDVARGSPNNRKSFPCGKICPRSLQTSRRVCGKGITLVQRSWTIYWLITTPTNDLVFAPLS